MSELFGPLLIGLLCIGIAFLMVIGIVVLLSINRKRSRELKAIPPSWHSVKGRVVSSKVEEAAHMSPDEDFFFFPSIQFEYSVEGNSYTGEKAVGKSTNLEYIAKRKLTLYPPGTEVVVYYNPEKPEDNRLSVK